MSEATHDMRIELPEHVERILRDLAAARGMSAEELMREALDSYLQQATDDERG